MALRLVSRLLSRRFKRLVLHDEFVGYVMDCIKEAEYPVLRLEVWASLCV